ncbi:rRNA small subunit methyltransferase G-domain-containing protein [Pavlovales sp. CCMP2436]|nr:rRNA small subunit methyltransferase G-domain-containing protein [Pavlovales sp. CCMP2436]
MRAGATFAACALPHLLLRTAPPCVGRPAMLSYAVRPGEVDQAALAAVYARFPVVADLAEGYVKALLKYNEGTNIYSQGAYGKLPFHIHDSLTLGALIARAPGSVVDLGSGSGLPAVLVALSNPGVSVWSVESKGRKTAFLRAVAAELQITNLHVLTINIVELSRAQAFDVSYVTAKAFKPLNEVIPLARKAIIARARLLVPVSEPQIAELAGQKVLDPATDLERIGEFTYFSRDIDASDRRLGRTVVPAVHLLTDGGGGES